MSDIRRTELFITLLTAVIITQTECSVALDRLKLLRIANRISLTEILIK